MLDFSFTIFPEVIIDEIYKNKKTKKNTVTLSSKNK